MPDLSRLLTATLLLAGCFGPVTEDDYAAAYARAWCNRTRECSRGYFDHEYNDLEDCEGEVTDQIEEAQDLADDMDCRFDEDNADECIVDLRATDCEDYYEGRWVDGCIDTWDDCDFNPFG